MRDKNILSDNDKRRKAEKKIGMEKLISGNVLSTITN